VPVGVVAWLNWMFGPSSSGSGLRRYLLFSEGYHGSSPRDPVRPFLCEDALRLTELLLDAKATAYPEAHAMAALFCFDAAACRPALTPALCSSPSRTRTGAAGIGRALSAV
jgi:hypothetical protein